MVVYLSKSRRFIECLEINAATIDQGHGRIVYTDITAVLPDGRIMSLINKREYSNHSLGYNFEYPRAQVNEEEKETAKQVWEKIKKTLLSGKTPSVKL